MSPIQTFNQWLNEEASLTKVRIPTACCLSTIGTDGFPNARFVSLKEIIGEEFIVTGPLTSRKGIEISQTNKVALTFWWTETERQVRVQGVATQIPNHLADKYFSERNRDSQIVSIVSEQGQAIESFDLLVQKYEQVETTSINNKLQRPKNWGGYSIKPIRIELLEFKTTRFHYRQLFEFVNEQWVIKYIQP